MRVYVAGSRVGLVGASIYVILNNLAASAVAASVPLPTQATAASSSNRLRTGSDNDLTVTRWGASLCPQERPVM